MLQLSLGAPPFVDYLLKTRLKYGIKSKRIFGVIIMVNNMVEETKHTGFGIKLFGDMEGVDANTLVDVLGNLSLAIHQINDDIQSNKSLKITIKYIQPGCYDIFLAIQETILEAILNQILTSPVTTASEIVGILAGLIVIRKFLKGEEPKEIKEEKNLTIIIDGVGNKLEIDTKTYNIFKSDQVVDAAIGKSFDTLSSDEAIEGLEIYDQNKKNLCKVESENFEYMSLPSPMPEQDTRKKPEEAILTIFKVVFEKGYKWQFYYQGNKISADIKDETFYSQIDSGIKFSKGDKLIADIEIQQVFDKTIQSYINKEYSIIKIKQRIPREEQSNIFPKNNNKEL